MENKNAFKQIEFYLYNYHNIDNLIREIEEEIISCTNISANVWMTGLKSYNANTVENIAIRIIENKRINRLRKWKTFLRKLLKSLHDKETKIYAFIKLKYFDKNTKDEIEQKLKLNINIQKDITNKVVSFIYKYAKIEGLDLKEGGKKYEYYNESTFK